MNYSRPMIVSIFVHLVLVVILSIKLSGGDGDGNSKSKQDNVSHIKIIEKMPDDKIKEEKPVEGTLLVKQIKKKIEKKPKEIECKEHYFGIGIERDWATCTVSKVLIGYPAFMNGVQQGDMIIAPECGQIIGLEGTTIDLKILRGGQIINLSFKRGKICGTK